jgi:nucleoside-diphosphate-sugar epimerase
MNVGIIGARGFVGAHLLEYLKTLDIAATGYTRETLDLSKPESLANLGAHDVVVNCAAQVSGSAAELFATNVQGVHGLCAELNRRVVKPYLLQLSSGAVYGYANHAVDAYSAAAPVGDYALTKLLGDEVVRLHYQSSWAIARLYFPYGEGQAQERLIPRLVKRVLAGETIDVSQHGGCPLINPMYIGDLCRQLHGMARDRVAGTHLLGGRELVSIRDIAQMIGRISGVEVKFRESDGAVSSMFCVGDGQVALEQGLVRLINSMRGEEKKYLA